MTLSDPNRPGISPRTESDATMVRPPNEFHGEAASQRNVGPAGHASEWVNQGSYQQNEPQGRPVEPHHQPAMPQPRSPLGGAGSFAKGLKEKARTVSAGMAVAAAGAMGGNDGKGDPSTGHAASAAPTPNEETTAIRRTGGARRTRKARLRIAQVDPWSVMKTAFLFAVAAGIVLWVATGTVWAVISSSGMFGEINRMVGDIIQTPGDDTPFRIQDYISTNKVMGTAALIAVIDVVIFTALATLGAFLYNLASAMIGGLEVTLAED